MSRYLENFDFEIYDAINVKVMKRLGEDILVSKRELNTKYLDIDGKSIAKISSKEAKKIVQDRTTLNPISAEEIIKQKNGSEYRGRELPLYKVLSSDIDDKEINVYLNMYSGEIVAIRSFQWSVWDLMWGFHIMDWQERDDINNLLLKIFSILALLSAITGILLFFKVDINSGVSTDE